MEQGLDQPTVSQASGASINQIIEALAATRSPLVEPTVEEFLAKIPAADQWLLLQKLITLDIQIRQERGEPIDLDSYIQRFPSKSKWLQENFAEIESSIGSRAETRPDLSQTKAVTKLPDLDLVSDRYQLQERLGRGGFGEVWLAYDRALDRKVAIKRIRTDRLHKIDQTQLLEEGRRVARLNHDGIVHVFMLSDQLYLVSELMPGGTLETRLHDGVPSITQSLRWVISLARALHYAHLQGIFHRDIKPSNVLFDSDETPHLSDFGTAISKQELSEETPQVIGTVQYMSPEQARGDSNLVDAQSDIYSLGVVLFRLVTGQFPYPDKPLDEYLQQIINLEPLKLRQLQPKCPESLEQLCIECLNKNADQRPATALIVADRLKRCLEQLEKSSRKTPTLLLAGLIALALALAFAAGVPLLSYSFIPKTGSS